MINLNNRNSVFLTVILFVFSITALFLHLWKIGEIPNGFFIDEASIGYNAWCILKTGTDEYGNRLPLFFKAFDNYFGVVSGYSPIPFMSIFGPEKWVVRLPSALYHLAASAVFGMLVYHFFRRNLIVAVSGAFIFSVIPWAFPLSRVMLASYTAMLLGINIGFLFFVRAFGENSYKAAIISALGWAFCMYAHHTGRPAAAFTLILFTLFWYKPIMKRWKIFMTFCLSLIIFMIPMIIAVSNNPAILTSRLQQISLENTDTSGLSSFFTRYAEYFNLEFLFITGDNNIRHNNITGELFIFLFPFVLCGLWYIIRNFKRNPYCRLLVAGLLAYPIASALTMDHYHATRSMNGLCFWGILCVFGFKYLWDLKRHTKLWLCVILIGGAIEISYYMYNYFTEYPVISRESFDAPFTEALEFAFKERKNDEHIYISPSAFPLSVKADFKPLFYIDILFLGKVPPGSINKIALPYEEDKIISSGLLIRRDSFAMRISKTETSITANDEPIPDGAVLLRKITVDEKKSLEIYRFNMADLQKDLLNRKQIKDPVRVYFLK